MIVQIRAEAGGDRLRDLHRRQLDAALADSMLDQGRGRKELGLASIEHSLDFAVPLHTICEAHPAGALARRKKRSYQGENAGRLDDDPGRPIRQMALVQLRKRFFEIVADQRNCQIGGTFDNARSEFAQRLAQFRFPLNINRVDADTALFKISFPRQQAAAPNSPSRQRRRRS